jgi:hypothetical protein
MVGSLFTRRGELNVGMMIIVDSSLKNCEGSIFKNFGSCGMIVSDVVIMNEWNFEEEM